MGLGADVVPHAHVGSHVGGVTATQACGTGGEGVHIKDTDDSGGAGEDSGAGGKHDGGRAAGDRAAGDSAAAYDSEDGGVDGGGGAESGAQISEQTVPDGTDGNVVAEDAVAKEHVSEQPRPAHEEREESSTGVAGDGAGSKPTDGFTAADLTALTMAHMPHGMKKNHARTVEAIWDTAQGLKKEVVMEWVQQGKHTETPLPQQYDGSGARGCTAAVTVKAFEGLKLRSAEWMLTNTVPRTAVGVAAKLLGANSNSQTTVEALKAITADDWRQLIGEPDSTRPTPADMPQSMVPYYLLMSLENGTGHLHYCELRLFNIGARDDPTWVWTYCDWGDHRNDLGEDAHGVHVPISSEIVANLQRFPVKVGFIAADVASDELVPTKQDRVATSWGLWENNGCYADSGVIGCFYGRANAEQLMESGELPHGLGMGAYGLGSVLESGVGLGMWYASTVLTMC